jgi:hypothetical protein
MLTTNLTTDHRSRRVAVSGKSGRLDKPDANHKLESRIGTGLLALGVGFVGLGWSSKRAYEVAAHPLSRISPQMSVITVTPARKPHR